MQALHLIDFDKTRPKTLADSIDVLLCAGEATLASCADLPLDHADTVLDKLNDFYENILLELERQMAVLWHFNNVVSDEQTRIIYQSVENKITDFNSKVGQSTSLFLVYQYVLNNFDKLNQHHKTSEQKRALELAINNFTLKGVALDEQNKKEFADITARIAKLTTQFNNNVMDSTQAFHYPVSQDQLSGLTPTALNLLKNNAIAYNKKHQKNNHLQPSYVATLDTPSYLAVMQYADDRALRETLYHAYQQRASKSPFDNSDIMVEILQLRQKQANLLGFDDYSQISLATKMAQDKQQVQDFLLDLADVAKPFAQKEFDELQIFAQAHKEYPIDEIKPWDIAYYAEKLRKEKYAIDTETLRAYFGVSKVLDGLFKITKQLFGVQIKQSNASVWHSDVEFYEVYDNDQLIGGFYLDLYARNGKSGGAWLSGFQARSRTYLPVGFIVANFTPPTEHEAFLTLDEVTTLFHEFGHALHHLLSQVDVAQVSGIESVEWDAVELPSQFLENFALSTQGMALISEHKTNKTPLPADVLQAILDAKNFHAGLQTVRQLEFALFDLWAHGQLVVDFAQLLTIHEQVKTQVAVFVTPSSNRFANSFGHIFAGGYACGYYSYKWAEVLSADAFGAFLENGILDKATGMKFRHEILATAGSRSAKENFVAFRGRKADSRALLVQSGFIDC